MIFEIANAVREFHPKTSIFDVDGERYDVDPSLWVCPFKIFSCGKVGDDDEI